MAIVLPSQPTGGILKIVRQAWDRMRGRPVESGPPPFISFKADTILQGRAVHAVIIKEATGEIGYTMRSQIVCRPGEAHVTCRRVYTEEAGAGVRRCRFVVNMSRSDAELDRETLGRLADVLNKNLLGDEFAGLARFDGSLRAYCAMGSSITLEPQVTDYGRGPVVPLSMRPPSDATQMKPLLMPVVRTLTGLRVSNSQGLWQDLPVDQRIQRVIARLPFISRYTGVGGTQDDAAFHNTLLLTNGDAQGSVIRLLRQGHSYTMQLVVPEINFRHLGLCIGSAATDGVHSFIKLAKDGDGNTVAELTQLPPDKALALVSHPVYAADAMNRAPPTTVGRTTSHYS